MRNYGEVLRDVAIGHPVFLTRNGYGRYVIMDIEEYREYERMKAELLTEKVKNARQPEEAGQPDHEDKQENK